MLVSRTERELKETEKLAGNACVFAADIAKPQAARDAILRCIEQFGRLDALVHCAGLAPILKIEQTTDQQWHDIIDTNLSAAFYLRGQPGRSLWNKRAA